MPDIDKENTPSPPRQAHRARREVIAEFGHGRARLRVRPVGGTHTGERRTPEAPPGIVHPLRRAVHARDVEGGAGSGEERDTSNGNADKRDNLKPEGTEKEPQAKELVRRVDPAPVTNQRSSGERDWGGPWDRPRGSTGQPSNLNRPWLTVHVAPHADPNPVQPAPRFRNGIGGGGWHNPAANQLHQNQNNTDYTHFQTHAPAPQAQLPFPHNIPRNFLRDMPLPLSGALSLPASPPFPPFPGAPPFAPGAPVNFDDSYMDPEPGAYEAVLQRCVQCGYFNCQAVRTLGAVPCPLDTQPQAPAQYQPQMSPRFGCGPRSPRFPPPPHINAADAYEPPRRYTVPTLPGLASPHLLHQAAPPAQNQPVTTPYGPPPAPAPQQRRRLSVPEAVRAAASRLTTARPPPPLVLSAPPAEAIGPAAVAPAVIPLHQLRPAPRRRVALRPPRHALRFAQPPPPLVAGTRLYPHLAIPRAPNAAGWTHANTGGCRLFRLGVAHLAPVEGKEEKEA
ncbi:hypothetical protein MIND_01343600 [Mycena indigotica]|uniref:Uncharacterized protein n=1 Tax=Mycena indigotica TaxID=2126181 RepID=A0A8H6S1Q8_9AGAR|nr:uncharacterized protein MIND_01343600 [Mycena indigotica]KAF7289705.1 hypothetical protein MIND_01343600 [Mycena indigotica]